MSDFIYYTTLFVFFFFFFSTYLIVRSATSHIFYNPPSISFIPIHTFSLFTYIIINVLPFRNSSREWKWVLLRSYCETFISLFFFFYLLLLLLYFIFLFLLCWKAKDTFYICNELSDVYLPSVFLIKLKYIKYKSTKKLSAINTINNLINNYNI